MNPTKLIIDTDPGQDIDDLLAMAFALRRPELDVRAITTVTLPSDRRARLVKRLLRYLDRCDLPVAAGMQYPFRPFSGEEQRAQHDFPRTMNHAAFAEPEDPRDDPGAGDAVDLIARTVLAHPGEVVVACLGPLSNIACALRRHPSLAGKIKAIALMGGELALNRVEHNIGWDYVAADIVLTSGIPLAMGTWSVTRRFTLSLDDCKGFAASASPLCQALAQAVALWHPAQSWKPGPVMYDVFPIIWAFDPSYYTLAPMCVGVDTQGDRTRGMTVAGPGAPNAEVTTDLRAPELRELFLRTLLN